MTTESGELFPIDPNSPTPHRDKLQELLANTKLPRDDRESVHQALARYREWVGKMDALKLEGDDKVRALVELLGDYKRFVELEVIWDSEADFLFRQRGQLKLDNSIIEEFLPRLVDPAIIPLLRGRAYLSGPRTSFSAAYFTAGLVGRSRLPGLQVRTKDQDFTVGRKAYLRSSFDPALPEAASHTREVYLAFVAAECKTNLDKTMFQEVLSSAQDLKAAVPGARHYVLCEWLDMIPVSTSATSVDEVIILRGKRLASNKRKDFSSKEVRRANREWYEAFLTENPIRPERVLRFVGHLRAAFDETALVEEDVLLKGYF